MLVFLALNDQNPVTNNRTSMDILQSIQARFQAYDIPFLSYLSTGTILLVIQPGGESNLAGDRITYVQTALENLPQTVEEETGRKLAISARTRRFCGSRLIRCTSGQRCGWKTSAAKAA